MTGKALWEKYARENRVSIGEYDQWAFGVDADLLAALVAAGEKTATASAYPLYELEDEALPREGEYSVILDSQENAVCIVRSKRVYVTAFEEVTEEHARKEGEGDKSLTYWRKVHEDFFRACLGEAGLAFTPEMKVVCEEFEVVYKA
ncbi:MAG: ASCH domain-containing protein [Oscillospiraceae bacterium]|nr:ASCH domain-containing protein [Oscillospiraceae bacterium]